MQKNNWLLNYSSIKGIEDTLTAMTKRSGAIYNLNESIFELQNHYSEYETEFFVFFQEMILFVSQQKEILKNHGI
jgi:acyl carrier protein phosphodiesterase